MILELNKFKVITASNKAGTAIAKDNSKAHVDIATDKVKASDYSGIFIVGGPGALEDLDNQTTYNILKDAKENNIPFGAICISTRILARAGVIEGKNVTGWDGDNELVGILQKHGANYIKNKKSVIDGNTVTAVDPSSAKEFGQNIVKILKK